MQPEPPERPAVDVHGEPSTPPPVRPGPAGEIPPELLGGERHPVDAAFPQSSANGGQGPGSSGGVLVRGDEHPDGLGDGSGRGHTAHDADELPCLHPDSPAPLPEWRPRSPGPAHGAGRTPVSAPRIPCALARVPAAPITRIGSWPGTTSRARTPHPLRPCLSSGPDHQDRLMARDELPCPHPAFPEHPPAPRPRSPRPAPPAPHSPTPAPDTRPRPRYPHRGPPHQPKARKPPPR